MKKFFIFLMLFSIILISAASCGKKDKLAVYPGKIGNTEISYDEDDNPVAIFPQLYIQFNYSDAGSSPAKLELIGSDLKTGVTITPDIRGRWTWQDESSLVFTPTNEWSPSTEYKIDISPDIFAKQYADKTRSIKVVSPAFSASMQDQRILRSNDRTQTITGVFTIGFSNQVDKDSFEKAAQVSLDGKNVKLKIDYDVTGHLATITTEPIAISETSKKLLFKAADFSPLNSKAKTKEELRASLSIPDNSGFFYVKEVSSSIVRNDKNDPQQIITLEFTDTVSNDIVNKNIKLFLVRKKDIRYNDLNSLPNEQGYEIPLSSLSAVESKKIDLNFSAFPQKASENDYQIFSIDQENSKDYFIVVALDKTISSSSGFPFKKHMAALLPIPSYPKELYINNDGAILGSKGEKFLSMTARGLSAVRFEIGTLLDYQIQHVINFTEGGGLDADFKGDDIDENNFASFATATISLSSNSKKEAAYASVDLSKYMNPKTPLYFIKAVGLDGDNVAVTSTIKKAILVTDMVIIQKKNSNNSSNVYVASIANGSPVYGANVSIMGKNGRMVYRTQTNEDGEATIPSLSDYSREKTPIAIIAEKDNDISFLPLNNERYGTDFSRFDIEGVYQESNYDSLKAYLISSRGMYRPGDEVNLSGIVKQNDWRSLAGLPVEFEIQDPNEKTVQTKRFTLNSEGMFDAEYKTLSTSPTGTYEAALYLIKNNSRYSHLGYTTFNVNEFEPDTMRLKLSILNKPLAGWIKPDSLSLYLKCDNMFGTPAAGRSISWNASINPTTFRFSGFDNYIFTDANVESGARVRNGLNIEIPTGVTDSNGEYNTQINRSAFPSGTFMFSAAAEVFSPDSGRSVMASDYGLVSNLDYIIGYKPSGDFSFIRRGTRQEVNFIAIDNTLKKIKLDNIKVSLMQIENVRSLVKGKDGAYRYMSIEKENLVEDTSVVILQDGMTLPINTDNPGQYVLKLSDGSGRTISKVRYFVSGESNAQMALDRNAELTVRLDRSQYSPGDEITLSITSPYSGMGLITIEKEKVYVAKWFKTNKTTTEQTITIPYNIEGNGYVNVSFVRSASSYEIYTSPYSYAVTPFSIDKDKRLVKLQVSAPVLTESGEDLEVQYSSDKNAKLVVFGVNEGILQVAGYRTPDPISFFFMKNALQVYTYQSASLILPDYSVIRELSRIGGGEAMLEAGLNPFARKTDKPAVFWSGILDAQAGQTYTYKYKTPSTFNGSMRIMILASAEGAVGAKSTDAIVRSPVVVTPNAPYSVANGDIFDIPVTISNNIETSTGNDKIAVSVSGSEHIEIIGDKMTTLDIKKGTDKTITFRVRALTNPGAASLNIKCENPLLKKPIATSVSFSVRPPVIFENTLAVGKFTGADFTIKDIFRNMYDHYAKRSVGASPSPLITLVGVSKYLENYPHGCTEQIISKTFPIVALAGDEAYASMSKSDAQKIISDSFNLIRARQNSSGGFAYWNNDSYFTGYLTVYAMHFYLDAKDAGFNLPNLTKGFKYIENFLTEEPETDFDVINQSYGIYLLARNGAVVSRQINRLEEFLANNAEGDWKKSIVGAYIGAAYILMKNNEKGEALLRAYVPEDTKYVYESDFTSNTVRNAQYLYLVAKHAPSLLPKASPIVEATINAIAQGFRNTVNASYCSLALAAYSEASDKTLLPAFNATMDNKTQVKLETSEKAPYQTEFKNGVKEINAKFPKANDKGYFYYVMQNGYNIDLPNEYSKDVEIIREIMDKNGNRITEGTQGDEVTVRIRIRAIAKNDGDNMFAITDLLTGGFDVVRNSIEYAGDDSEELRHYDIREDRVLFYMLLTNGTASEITYKAKLLASGEFILPAAYAESMYKEDVKANTKPGKFVVKNKK